LRRSDLSSATPNRLSIKPRLFVPIKVAPITHGRTPTRLIEIGAKVVHHARAITFQHDQLHEHLTNFVAAYNFAKRLKTLKGLTPYEYICKCWTNEPQRFTSNPHRQTPGPNI